MSEPPPELELEELEDELELLLDEELELLELELDEELLDEELLEEELEELELLDDELSSTGPPPQAASVTEIAPAHTNLASGA